MKTQKNLNGLIKTGATLILSAIMFTACKKDGPVLPPAVQNGKLAVLVSSPGAAELSLLINGAKATTAKPLTYNTTMDYSDFKSGAVEFGVTKKDATEVLAKITGTIKANTNYTLFLTDKSPKATVILSEDDLSAPATDKAKIRFVNLSPDATLLDLYLAGKTETGISKKAFKDVSGFINVDAAAEAKFEIKENGKTDVLATLEKVKIEKGKIYTIYAKGLKDATDVSKLGIDVMINK
ncbi:DUF4397 domain-containing protein [Pedobacter psychrodurus]|uniref:DUF4397 domain-containing protein n=1 Tax=Pedobacter psychrodurus TaxID=2530456 RepID=UPI00292D7523|nr:DUF4397 domain-containing protein [Pedobacter psychrodurus]